MRTGPIYIFRRSLPHMLRVEITSQRYMLHTSKHVMCNKPYKRWECLQTTPGVIIEWLWENCQIISVVPCFINQCSLAVVGCATNVLIQDVFVVCVIISQNGVRALSQQTLVSKWFMPPCKCHSVTTGFIKQFPDFSLALN